jgi:hypothetical protein
LGHENAKFHCHESSLEAMPVEVRCATEGDGYRCTVDVSDATGTSRHLVRVSGKEFDRWRRGRSVQELVGDSFAFLLEREPRESILKEFDLSVIRRYFPDYDGA